MFDSSSPASSTTAGEAGNDDVEESNNAVDDGSEDGSDAIHNSHEACADGLEDAANLGSVSLKFIGRLGVMVNLRKRQLRPF